MLFSHCSESTVLVITPDETTESDSTTILDTDGDGIAGAYDTCADTDEGIPVDEKGCPPPIYLDETGITMKATDAAVIGGSYELNEVFYLVVDSTLLSNMIENEEDITQVITTFISNLSHLINRSPSWNLSWNYGVTFNQDISSWDVSNVTDMSDSFIDLPAFNQDISPWNVSNMTDMSGTFSSSTSFNQDLSGWEVSNVTKMGGMFSFASSFNQDLSAWVVDKVIDCNKFSINATTWITPKPNFTNCLE